MLEVMWYMCSSVMAKKKEYWQSILRNQLNAEVSTRIGERNKNRDFLKCLFLTSIYFNVVCLCGFNTFLSFLLSGNMVLELFINLDMK